MGTHHFPDGCIIEDNTIVDCFQKCEDILKEKTVSERLINQLNYYRILYECYNRYVDDGRKRKFEDYLNEANIHFGSIIFLMGLAPNVLGYRHPAAILDRSKNKCCGLITDGEELKNNQLCFSVDTTVLHLFSDLSRTCPRTSGGWIPPLALTPKNNRSVSFLVA